jgi:hypothetical protein
MILEGMLHKLKGPSNARKLEEIRASFQENVGMSYADFQKLVFSIS